MKIAVVTATITGREEMLARCVYSVAIQTRRPDRHLIGNGDGRPEADVLNELIGGSDCHAYWRRAFDAGARFAHVPEPLWVYRFHGNNMSV